MITINILATIALWCGQPDRFNANYRINKCRDNIVKCISKTSLTIMDGNSDALKCIYKETLEQ